MKKYLLILVMLISMVGYVVGLYGFFHNIENLVEMRFISDLKSRHGQKIYSFLELLVY